MEIKEAARRIIYCCGIGGYGPELADDHPLVVRSTAKVQEAADTYAADLKAENERLEAEIRQLRGTLASIWKALNLAGAILFGGTNDTS